MKDQYIVCGIGTDCGKSVAAVLLAELLQQKNNAYPLMIKPVETGQKTDTGFYKNCRLPAEKVVNYYHFDTAVSPHLAAQLAGRSIDFSSLAAEVKRTLSSAQGSIIELAGGLLAPLTTENNMLDLIQQLKLPVIVVAGNYIGAINHTLLTVAMLKQHKIPLTGLLFNEVCQDSVSTLETFSYLEKETKLSVIGKIPHIEQLEQLQSPLFRKKLISNWRLSDEK